MKQVLLLFALALLGLSVASAESIGTTPKRSTITVKFGDSYDSVVQGFEQRYEALEDAGRCAKIEGCSGSGRASAAYFLKRSDVLDILPKACIAGRARNAFADTHISFDFDSRKNLNTISIIPSKSMSDKVARLHRDAVIRVFNKEFGTPIQQQTNEPPDDEGWSATWRADDEVAVSLDWTRHGLGGIHCYLKPLYNRLNQQIDRAGRQIKSPVPIAPTAQKAPKGYAIAEIAVNDPGAYRDYVAAVTPLIAKHGGVYLVRAGKTTVKEGAPPQGRIVVIEFPSFVAAQAFYDSAEYQAIISLRTKVATSRVMLVEGAAP
jgi:uncharacterized protein (DUF1330 family)